MISRAQWQPRVRRRALKGRAGVGFMQSVPSALEALKANKSRSALTTLGIVIGGLLGPYICSQDDSAPGTPKGQHQAGRVSTSTSVPR